MIENQLWLNNTNKVCFKDRKSRENSDIWSWKIDVVEGKESKIFGEGTRETVVLRMERKQAW